MVYYVFSELGLENYTRARETNNYLASSLYLESKMLDINLETSGKTCGALQCIDSMIHLDLTV
jgi:hypothetical protein